MRNMSGAPVSIHLIDLSVLVYNDAEVTHETNWVHTRTASREQHTCVERSEVACACVRT